MGTTYGSKARRQRIRRSKQFRWSVAALVLGTLLVTGAGVASATILLHGQGELTAPATRGQGLVVTDVRLSEPLAPGAWADLKFDVRNPNTFSVRITGLSLLGGLRQAKPAGCTTKVAGPATRPAGYRLPTSGQVLVPGTRRAAVTVPKAFTLAATATAGCGFTALLDVQGTQVTVTAAEPAPAKKAASPPAISLNGVAQDVMLKPAGWSS